MLKVWLNIMIIIKLGDNEAEDSTSIVSNNNFVYTLFALFMYCYQSDLSGHLHSRWSGIPRIPARRVTRLSVPTRL